MPKIPNPRKKPKLFKCPWCKKEFLTLAKLQAHGDKCPNKPE